MEYKEVIELLVKIIEVTGVGAMVLGLLAATLLFFIRLSRHKNLLEDYRNYRQHIGRSILLGLEFLVAADIIESIVIPSTFESVGILVLIILIRSFLAIELEMEIEGKWPWQQSKAK